MATAQRLPKKTKLTRERIVAEAIKASDKRTLSMRNLAERLRVTPMALYAHVADKDELLDEILDHVLARDARPLPPDPEWRTWMLAFAEQLHNVLIDRPELLARYCRRPVGVATALERMEAALGVLLAAGFDDAGALDVFATVQTVTLGFTALEAARRTELGPQPVARASTVLDPRAPRYWSALFAALPEERFPILHRTRPDLAELTSPRRFREVLTATLDGFRPQVAR